MTEQRQERNRRNSKEFNDVVVWSIENFHLWVSLSCGDTPDGATIHQSSAAMDECRSMGFVGLYYLALWQVACTVEIGADMERLADFLKVCVDENITLDWERIAAAVKKGKMGEEME